LISVAAKRTGCDKRWVPLLNFAQLGLRVRVGKAAMQHPEPAPVEVNLWSLKNPDYAQNSSLLRRATGPWERTDGAS